MKEKIEYAIMAVTTGKVFPKTFDTPKEAQQFRDKRPDPSHWKVVHRTITYSDWKDNDYKGLPDPLIGTGTKVYAC